MSWFNWPTNNSDKLYNNSDKLLGSTGVNSSMGDPVYWEPVNTSNQHEKMEDTIKKEISLFIIQHLHTTDVTEPDVSRIKNYLLHVIPGGKDMYDKESELINKLVETIPDWFKGSFDQHGTYIQNGGRISKRIKNRRTTRRKGRRNNKKTLRRRRISK